MYGMYHVYASWKSKRVREEREREREMPISHSVLGVKYCTQEGGKLGGETRREIEENGAQKVPSLEVERRHLSFVP